MLIRWPQRIPAGKVSNGIPEHQDLFVTLAAAAGVPNVVEQLRESDKVYIDGVNNLEHGTGDAPSARNIVYYYNEKELTAIRIGNWKSHFQTRDGFFDYHRPSASIVNLRMDPFEKHDGQKKPRYRDETRNCLRWSGAGCFASAYRKPAAIPTSSGRRNAASRRRVTVVRLSDDAMPDRNHCAEPAVDLIGRPGSRGGRGRVLMSPGKLV